MLIFLSQEVYFQGYTLEKHYLVGLEGVNICGGIILIMRNEINWEHLNVINRRSVSYIVIDLYQGILYRNIQR